MLLVAAGITIAGACTLQKPDAILPAELQSHVSFLASDELAGRNIATAGIAAAERYIAAQFEASGLLPLPDQEDHFLDFELFRNEYGSEFSDLEVRIADTVAAFKPGESFRPFTFSHNRAFKGEVIFAGFGITAPEYSYDDYADLDVTGRVVLVLRYEPDNPRNSHLFKGTVHTNHATFLSKAKNAQKHGAIAMLQIDNPAKINDWTDFRLYDVYAFTENGLSGGGRSEGSIGTAATGSPSPKPSEPSIPAMQISNAMAQLLLDTDAAGLLDLQNRINAGESPTAILSADDRQTASVELSIADGSTTGESDAVAVRNVAAYIPGSTDEWIVIGAHHDHVGSYVGDGDTIFNGADDNASGTSLVLELAEYFSSKAELPRWNMMFITFTAEEKGLFGSRALENWIALSSVAFMFNFDMIGRNPDKPVLVYGDGYITGMGTLLDELAAITSIEIHRMGRETFFLSDHQPFFEHKVPNLWFHTDDHDDYHRESDHAPLLDYPRMAAIGRLTVQLIDALSSNEADPEWK